MQVKDLAPAEWPWPLLLDADPSPELINAYIHQSTVMGLMEGEAAIAPEGRSLTVAVIVLLQRDQPVVEVMNIAVAPDHQGEKLGKLLLAAAIDRDYFVRTYPAPIFGNGIWCRDRILLSQDL